MPTCAEQTTDAPNKCLNFDRDVPGRLQDCQGQDCLQERKERKMGNQLFGNRYLIRYDEFARSFFEKASKIAICHLSRLIKLKTLLKTNLISTLFADQ